MAWPWLLGAGAIGLGLVWWAKSAAAAPPRAFGPLPESREATLANGSRLVARVSMPAPDLGRAEQLLQQVLAARDVRVDPAGAILIGADPHAVEFEVGVTTPGGRPVVVPRSIEPAVLIVRP